MIMTLSPVLTQRAAAPFRQIMPEPQVVFVGEDNRIERITTYEKHGLLRDMA